MELILTRTYYDNVCTEGRLETDGFSCYTLELPYVCGMTGTAISEGRYKIFLGPSPKFMSSKDPWILRYAEKMPHLAAVANRSQIMIHFGNDAKDTEGCILVGLSKGIDFIGSSRAAFEKLYNLLQAAMTRQEDIYLVIQRASSAS